MTTNVTPDDAFAVQQLYGRYADALHRGDANDWGQTWCSDARWSLPIEGVPDMEGRDAIVATWNAVVENLKVVQHLPLVPAFKMDGGVLCARWTVREIIVTGDGQGQEILGVYDDTHREEDGILRYQSRNFKLLYRRPIDASSFEVFEHPGPF